jgi:hypothetical protein
MCSGVIDITATITRWLAAMAAIAKMISRRVWMSVWTVDDAAAVSRAPASSSSEPAPADP